MADIGLAPGEDDEIGAGRGALIGDRHLGGRTEPEAIAGAQLLPFPALDDDKRASLHPDRLADARIGRGGQDDLLPRGISTSTISSG